MSTTHAFLTSLNQQQIKLWVEGDELRINAPKGALTPTLVDQLRARKAEILSFLQQRTSTNGYAPAILPVARDAELPLSFAQQRLWFLAQLEGPSATYNIPAALRLTGALDQEALKQSLLDIVQRHEALRTTFPMDAEGSPRQRINPVSLDWTVVELSHLAAKEQEAEVRRLSRQEAEHAFDLATGPLLRVRVLRLSQTSHVLLLTMHHIISDGWSIDLFLRTLSTLYAAYRDEKPSPLPSLDIHYADFAVWQRKWLRGDILDKQLAYWQTQLADAPVLLNLPTDHPRPAKQSYRGDHYAFALPAELSEQLKQLSQQMGVTLFMTLQAALAVLLSRYVGQEDILIGTPVANRQRRELEPLIGFFANTLVLRNNLAGNPTFGALLERVRETALAAYQHQDMPFTMLVEALQPERTTSHSPLFQVMYTLQSDSQAPLKLPGVTAVSLDVRFPVSKFDLSLIMQEADDELLGWWEYSTDLFELATIERMAGHFQVLLEAIVAAPDQPIGELPLLTEAERYQLLVTWNDTETDYPRDKCIHQLFEQQVERTPNAVAVVFEDEQLTYRELNEHANQLARYLIEQGVAPNVLVGICIERSIEMLVGLLAILKCGGTYVPLDPAFPRDRLQFMVEDADIQLILTQSALVDSLQLSQGAQMLCLDRLWDSLHAMADTNPVTDVSPDDLAYCIYTSGSTGKPKGVQISHRNVVNFLQTMQERPGLGADDTLVAVTTLSFDIAVLELFLPLKVGAKLVIAPREVAIDGYRLRRLIDDTNATHMQATPATWHLLLTTSGWPGKSDLRILCGGEALPRQLADELLPRCAELWNMYGPTESTIWSTVERVTADGASISIGRPIANTQSYILDHNMQPVPIGVVGDLYIGGDGVALGYLNRPQLTQDRFLANPFIANGRIYKTGDVARYLSNGKIEFLGRRDHQVKVRGFRIELGEIEALLSQHESVRETVVVVRGEAEQKRLVAYVVGTERLNHHTLRTHLSETLPHYMIPSAFMQLDTMPLTPNGKVNRRALPAPTRHAASETAIIMPQTGLERKIAEVWQAVLQLEKVGIHDNFFELGGHSLLLIQVHQLLQKAMKQELAVIDLFTYPTIHALAKYLSKHDASPDVRQDAERGERRGKRKAKARQRKRIRQVSRREK